MHIKEVLHYAYLNLHNHNIKNPHLEAEFLLSSILKRDRAWILVHTEHKLTRLQIINYKLQIKRRINGLPLSYLTGTKNFYGRDFIITDSVLIPRPETELMVEEVLGHVSTHVLTTRKYIFLDVGTGSGCIIISLLKEFNSVYPELNSKMNYFATEISNSALTVARKNAKLYKADKQIKFLHGNLLEPLFPKLNKLDLRNCKLVITANLPYLTPSQYNNSPTIQNEPKSALVAGSDGLKYYRQLFTQVKKIESDTKYQIPYTIYIEISPSQKNTIKSLAKKYFPESNIEIKKDLRGHSRLAVIKI